MNKTANGRVIKRANWHKIAVLVLFALAIVSVCLQSRVVSYKTPDFWTVNIQVANFSIQVFSGKLSGTGVLGTFESRGSADAVLARQLGIVYHDGTWEIVH